MLLSLLLTMATVALRHIRNASEWLIDAAWYTILRQQLHTTLNWAIDVWMDGWMDGNIYIHILYVWSWTMTMTMTTWCVSSRTQLRRWLENERKYQPTMYSQRQRPFGGMRQRVWRERDGGREAGCWETWFVGLESMSQSHTLLRIVHSGNNCVDQFHESDWLQSKCGAEQNAEQGGQSDQLKRLMMINYRAKLRGSEMKSNAGIKWRLNTLAGRRKAI